MAVEPHRRATFAIAKISVGTAMHGVMAAPIAGGIAAYPLLDFHDDRHCTVFHFKTAADAFAARFDGRVLPAVPPRKRR
jgi:hypothetical protein